MRLNNRVAIATGGASGIGKAVCLGFAREGAKVVIADILIETGRETETWCGNPPSIQNPVLLKNRNRVRYTSRDRPRALNRE